MPQIIPVTELQNTEDVVGLCRRSREPVFLTRDGYGALVLMEIRHYERLAALSSLAGDILDAEKEAKEKDTLADAGEALMELRRKYEDGFFGEAVPQGVPGPGWDLPEGL